MQRMTIAEIIKLAGGPRAIVAESISRGKIITVWAVHRWRRYGVPDDHWAVLIDLAGSGVTPERIFKANEALRRSSPSRRAELQPATAA